MQPGHFAIADPAVETQSADEQRAFADRAWTAQRERLARNRFVAARCRDAGVELTDVASVSELHRLPFTTKAELRQSQLDEPPFGAHLGVDPSEVRLVYQTSGTTGTPCIIALTADDCDAWWSIGVRSYRAAGITRSSSVLVPFGAGPFSVGHSHGTVDRIGARRVPVSPGDAARVIDAAQARLFDTLLCTPSFAVHLADRLLRDGPDPRGLGIGRVITGGEPGGGIPEVRRHIEQAFGCPVVEVMGIGDVAPSLFGECAQQDGMHFCGQGHVWPELVDPATGEPLAFEPGARGELVYTALQRQAMPVVRFRSGDIVEIAGGECACGRTSFRMRCVARVDDMFIVRGVNVYPSAVVGVIAGFRPRVTGRARVVLPVGAVAVEPPVRVEVETVDGGSSGGVVAEIEAALRARLTFRAAVSLVPTREFGDPAYKTPLVVRR